MLRALGFALAVLLFGAAPAAALVPADWLGVVVDGPLTDPAGGHEAEWDRIAGSGAAGVRTAVYWSQGQPSGPGAVDFSAYDGLVLAAAALRPGPPPIPATPDRLRATGPSWDAS
jgi:hypothetical protein